MSRSTHGAFAHGTRLDARVWHHLDRATPRTVKELHARTGLSATSIRTKLRHLAEAGLACEQPPRHWTRRGTDADLDRAASERGTTHREQQRIQQYERERASHRADFHHYLNEKPR